MKNIIFLRELELIIQGLTKGVHISYLYKY